MTQLEAWDCQLISAKKAAKITALSVRKRSQNESKNLKSENR